MDQAYEESTIRKHKKENFTQISNTLINEEGLSYRAKGIFSYMWSKPDTWIFRAEDIKNHGTEGKDAINTAIDDLIAHGYLVKIQRMKGNLKNGFDYYMSDEPNFMKDEISKLNNTVNCSNISSTEDSSVVESSTVHSVTAENPPYSNTNSNNTKSVADETSAKIPLEGDREGKILANKLVNNILTFKPNLKVGDKRESFAIDFALAIRKDYRSYEQMDTLLNWLVSDGKNADFWKTVVLSGKKFREQIDQLEINMKRDGYTQGTDGMSKDRLKQFLIKTYGQSKSFFHYSIKGKKVMVAFSSNYRTLANYNTGVILSRKDLDLVWEYMLKNHKTLFPNATAQRNQDHE